ncbi:DNA adenine methylase [Moorella sp. ACPs]|uniref:DNA adenine methylase n=1 Tax=Neomoorella carbonis TaxID=3062783 RepID=UPI003253D886
MPFATPLRYPGGKGRLGPWLGELVRYNRISGGWYVEPYAGGAGAAIYLLLEGYVDHIVINDIDPLIYAFWWAVLNDTDNLLRLINDTPITIDSWHKQKKVYASPEQYSTTEVGFATFFLNRTNRSGILTAGVIGGQGQKGHYKLDARFNKKELSRRIQRIAMRRRHISIYQLDALELLNKLIDDLPKKTLIYLDPPYYNKGSLLYKNYYKENDHIKVAEKIKGLKLPWVLTYDDCEPIRFLYRGYPSVKFSLHYSTNLKRPKATEIMFYGNLDLHAPPRLRR